MKIFEIQMLGPQDLSPMMDTPVGYDWFIIHVVSQLVNLKISTREKQ